MEVEGGYELQFGQPEPEQAIRLRVVMMDRRILLAIQEGPKVSSHRPAGERLMTQVTK